MTSAKWGDFVKAMHKMVSERTQWKQVLQRGQGPAYRRTAVWREQVKQCTWTCCLDHAGKPAPCPVTYHTLFPILTVAQKGSSAPPQLQLRKPEVRNFQDHSACRLWSEIKLWYSRHQNLLLLSKGATIKVPEIYCQLQMPIFSYFSWPWCTGHCKIHWIFFLKNQVANVLRLAGHLAFAAVTQTRKVLTI